MAAAVFSAEGEASGLFSLLARVKCRPHVIGLSLKGGKGRSGEGIFVGNVRGHAKDQQLDELRAFGCVFRV